MLMFGSPFGDYSVPTNQAAINSATGRTQAMQQQSLAMIRQNQHPLAMYQNWAPESAAPIYGTTVSSPTSTPGVFTQLGAGPLMIEATFLPAGMAAQAAALIPGAPPAPAAGTNWLMWGGIALAAFLLWRHLKAE